MTVQAPVDNVFAVPAGDEQIERAATALREHGFKVEIHDTVADARSRIEEIIPEKASVYTSASKTLEESGIDADLNASGRYLAVKPRTYSMDRTTQADEIRRLRSTPDYAVGSVAAVTEDGSLVAVSASGSQIPAYGGGARQVILVVGAQKVVPDLDTAMTRVDTYALPLEDVRTRAVYGVSTAKNKVLIVNGDPFGGVTVLLLRQAIGY
jgi:YkgG family uncharacterized protein